MNHYFAGRHPDASEVRNIMRTVFAGVMFIKLGFKTLLPLYEFHHSIL